MNPITTSSRPPTGLLAPFTVATPTAIAASADAGFEIEHYRRLAVAPCIVTAPVAPHVLGIARRPA